MRLECRETDEAVANVIVLFDVVRHCAELLHG